MSATQRPKAEQGGAALWPTILSRPLFVISIVIGIQICSSRAFAQKENTHWQFFSGTLEFENGLTLPNTDTLPPEISNGSTYSDRIKGLALFHTDGNYIYNRFGGLMPHGGGLSGDTLDSNVRPFPAISLETLIIPVPGSSSQYYVFSDSYFATGGNEVQWITYSLIDMSLDSGRGDVVYQQRPLVGYSVGWLTATWHANGCDIWVVCHDAFSDKYYSFLVTPNGINPVPVISNVGPREIYKDFYWDQDPFVINPQGTLLAKAFLPCTEPGNVCLKHINVFYFDKSTGKLREFVSLRADPWQTALAFSPNGSKVYLTNESGDLKQIDLSSGDSATIEHSGLQLIAAGRCSVAAWMGLGPDGKIYIANGNVGSIEHPDSAGVACGFQDSTIIMRHRVPMLRFRILSAALPFVRIILANAIAL